MSAEPIRADAPGRRNAEIRIAVEGHAIQRLVERNLGPDLDLGREPVLPANTALDVGGLGAGALPLRIVERFEAERDVVQRLRLVVQIHHARVDICRAREQGGVAALGEARRIERHVLRRERRTAGIERGKSGRIVRVEHIILVLPVTFRRDMPVVVEDVIVGEAVPLQVVVSPLAAIDAVGNEIDVVLAVCWRSSEDRR